MPRGERLRWLDDVVRDTRFALLGVVADNPEQQNVLARKGDSSTNAACGRDFPPTSTFHGEIGEHSLHDAYSARRSRQLYTALGRLSTVQDNNMFCKLYSLSMAGPPCSQDLWECNLLYPGFDLKQAPNTSMSSQLATSSAETPS